MNILLWIIFGGIAGWVASLIVSGAGMGIVGNVVVGILGAFIGGWIADRIGFKAGEPGIERPSNFWPFLWAVIGSVILLSIVNLIF